MSASAFFDTNVFVYAIVQDDQRSSRAEELLLEGGTVSVQILNEFAAVARRKAKMTWDEVRFGLENIERLCPNPLPVTIDTHSQALAIAEKYGFRIYDALMVASALEARCTILYSEDMQDGQIIDHRLTIRNPFRLPA
ncbi:MAG TPA: PIN domain-containing protein [Candidatus Acidoferrum sp.]|jgi:predicted nucleic acid-binding protein|nr:PIN domain-containing protein [Candidatus Acidoferrum sp.]